MKNDEPLLTEADRIQEELVAFLDDELSDDASERVRQRLRTDPAYRQQLKELQAAWDLLDELPRAPATESFTQTTVEMVRLTAEAEVLTTERRLDVGRRWRIGALLAGVALAALAGYGVMYARLDHPNQRLIQDLPVIENVDLYRVADSAEFLHLLDESNLFDEDPTDVP